MGGGRGACSESRTHSTTVRRSWLAKVANSRAGCCRCGAGPPQARQSHGGVEERRPGPRPGRPQRFAPPRHALALDRIAGRCRACRPLPQSVPGPLETATPSTFPPPAGQPPAPRQRLWSPGPSRRSATRTRRAERRSVDATSPGSIGTCIVTLHVLPGRESPEGKRSIPAPPPGRPCQLPAAPDGSSFPLPLTPLCESANRARLAPDGGQRAAMPRRRPWLPARQPRRRPLPPTGARQQRGVAR